jgi:hypothetical protein
MHRRLRCRHMARSVKESGDDPVSARRTSNALGSESFKLGESNYRIIINVVLGVPWDWHQILTYEGILVSFLART